LNGFGRRRRCPETIHRPSDSWLTNVASLAEGEIDAPRSLCISPSVGLCPPLRRNYRTTHSS
jgi:hypothetical protein